MRKYMSMIVVATTLTVVGCGKAEVEVTQTTAKEEIHLEFVPQKEDRTKAEYFKCYIHTPKKLYAVDGKDSMERFLLIVRGALIKNQGKVLCIYMEPFPGEGVFLRLEEVAKEYGMTVKKVNGRYEL